MEENNNIDDLFRSAIESFEMKPSPKGKEKLFAELGKKRKAGNFKKGLGFISISIVLLFVGFTGYRYFKSSSSKKSAPVEFSTNINEPISSVVSGDEAEPAIPNNTTSNSSVKNTFVLQSKDTPTNTAASDEANSTTVKNSENKSSLASPPKNDFQPGIAVTTTSKVSQLPSRSNIQGNKLTQKPTATLDDKKAGDNSASTTLAIENINESFSTSKKQGDKLSKVNSTSKETYSNEAVVIPITENNQPVNAEFNRIKQPANPASTQKATPDIHSVQPSDGEVLHNEKTESTLENQNREIQAANNVKEVSATLPSSSIEEKSSSTPPENPSVIVSEKNSIKESISENNIPKENLNKSDITNSNPIQSENTVVENTVSKQESADSATTLAENKQPENASTAAEIAPTSASASLIKKMLSHLSAEMYFSPDYVNNRYKTNYTYTGSASKNPDDYSDQKPEFSYSTGIRLGYDMGKKWSVVSGISYSSYSQNAVYNTISVISDSIYKEEHVDHGHGNGGGHNGGGHNHEPPNSNNDHHYVIHTPHGDIDLHNEPPRDFGCPEPQNGDALNIKTEISQTIQFIYVPLLVRYHFGKNKLSYFVEGGGAMNIVSKDKINVYVNDAFQETNNLDGLKQFNYSLLLGTGIQYNFYKGLSTFIQPSFRYTITPMNQNNPIYSYPYYIGIGTGFSIHF